MSHHPNAFRARGPIQVDISRLPQEVKVALDRPVEWREGEVACQSTGYLPPRTITNARLWVAATVNSRKMETVSMRTLDYRGIDAISQIEISKEDLPNLLGRFIEIYKTQGGTEEALLEMYQKESNS